jgi:hypothetical protein
MSGESGRPTIGARFGSGRPIIATRPATGGAASCDSGEAR